MQTPHASAPAKIFLARHCESEFNAENRVAGQLDSALSPKGRAQACDLAQVLQGEPLTAIYASSLTRAVQTAQPTAEARGLPIFTRDALKEIHMGVLQGRFRDERDPEAQRIAQARKQDKAHYRVPGGETFQELADRVLPCLNEIVEREAGGAILIVGHRRTNAVILATLMGWPPDRAVQLDLRQKYLYEIRPGLDISNLPICSTLGLLKGRVCVSPAGVEPGLATIRLDASALGRRYEEFRE